MVLNALLREAMWYREKFIAAHYQADFYMMLRFRLIDELEKPHYDDSSVLHKYKEAIETLAKGVVDGKFTRYNLTDEYVKKQYGINDYIINNLITDFAFYQAGIQTSKSVAHPILDYLEEVDENMDGAYFIGYSPDEDTMRGLLKSLEGQAIEVARKSRDIDRQEGALERLCHELDEIEDEDGIIGKINHYNDGSYMEIWGAVNCLAYYLRAKEMWGEFYQLLCYMKYFPLQGGLIRILNSVQDIEAVIEEVDKQQGNKHIQYLLRDQWLRTICEEGAILEHNMDVDGLRPEDKEFIEKAHQQFENDKLQHIQKAVGIWIKTFGKEELSAWASKKTSEAEGKHEKYGKPELDILQMVSAEINVTSTDVVLFNLEDKSFASLLTYAEKVTDKQAAVKVTEAIVSNLFSDKSYPDTELSEKWFNHVRTIYHCLKLSQLDGFKILQTHRKPLEGFKVDWGVSLRSVRQEAYWLAVLILSLEESGNESDFERLCEWLLRDTINSISSMTDDVFTPYYVAELLVTQVMTSKKDWFEKKLIEEIPYLVFVIRVLTANQGEMSENVKGILAKRIQQEWDLERMLLSKNRFVNIKFYDEFVKKMS